MSATRIAIVENLLNKLIAEYSHLTNVANEFGEPIRLYALFDEAESISKKFPHCYDTARLGDNLGRNRYSDVLPPEDSRFKSSNLAYINANVVDDKYILTQGPIGRYINEFWTMVWDSGAMLIVCLANQIEKGKTKFDPYFNGTVEGKSPALGGEDDFHIKLESVTGNRIITRIIKVTLPESLRANSLCGESRIITHIQYTNWPDNGLPDKNSDLLTICSQMDILSYNTPTIIHCSAGIGRTGTLCAIHRIISVANDILRGTIIVDTDFKLDVQRTILELRRCRAGLVQTKPQFQCCYETAIDGIKKLLGKN
jgi:protein tyrosine phosphatase